MPASLCCIHRSPRLISCATPALGWARIELDRGGGLSICQTVYAEVYIFFRLAYTLRLNLLPNQQGRVSIILGKVVGATQHERGSHQFGESPFALSSTRSGRIEG
jgi:hypothetical protein